MIPASFNSANSFIFVTISDFGEFDFVSGIPRAKRFDDSLEREIGEGGGQDERTDVERL